MKGKNLQLNRKKERSPISSFPRKQESHPTYGKLLCLHISNKPKGVLYIGLTNELERRPEEHKTKRLKGFTNKYNIDKLVYFEEFDTYEEAFTRERRLKKWKRDWKIELIEKENPSWSDLSAEWF